MHPSTDSSAILNYHRYMAREHGRQSSLALGWLGITDQLARFKTLAGMADMSGCSVLDAGCGYGDLLPFLSGLYQGVQYTGIEQIPEFIDEALKRYGKWEEQFYTRKFYG